MLLVLPPLLANFSHLQHYLYATTILVPSSSYIHLLLNDLSANYSHSFLLYNFTSNPRASLNLRTSSSKICPFSIIVASFNTGSFSPSINLSTYLAYPLLSTPVTLYGNIAGVLSTV